MAEGRACFVLTRGDGSERCLICRQRQADRSWYVTTAKWRATWPESVGVPVCSWLHAAEWIEYQPRLDLNLPQHVRP